MQEERLRGKIQNVSKQGENINIYSTEESNGICVEFGGNFTLAKYEFIHFANVFFWTSSRSSETK